MATNKAAGTPLSFSPSAFGLALTSSLSLVGMLTGLVLSVITVEQQGISVERIQKCAATCDTMSTDILSHGDGCDHPLFADGSISIKDMSVFYNEVAALSSVNVEIKSGSRVLITGRTGILLRNY
jgi:ABC-type multidrug transport system fused ATPase/permease subunit